MSSSSRQLFCGSPFGCCSRFFFFMFCFRSPVFFFFFFFNDTATTEIYPLSLHAALPISMAPCRWCCRLRCLRAPSCARGRDRKSTRLNSSHLVISYAVFCLKKKKNNK